MLWAMAALLGFCGFRGCLDGAGGLAHYSGAYKAPLRGATGRGRMDVEATVTEERLLREVQRVLATYGWHG